MPFLLLMVFFLHQILLIYLIIGMIWLYFLIGLIMIMSVKTMRTLATRLLETIVFGCLRLELSLRKGGLNLISECLERILMLLRRWAYRTASSLSSQLIKLCLISMSKLRRLHLMQYPADFINKIMCGNCTDVMKDIPDESIDLVVTSPPYNLNINKIKKDISKNWKGKTNNC